jgi:hypothetical protein
MRNRRIGNAMFRFHAMHQPPGGDQEKTAACCQCISPEGQRPDEPCRIAWTVVALPLQITRIAQNSLSEAAKNAKMQTA